MLNFVLEYQKAIKSMVADPDHNLGQYALSMQEWKIAAQLRDVLKVRHCCDSHGISGGAHSLSPHGRY
jgi:hypothetical protein